MKHVYFIGIGGAGVSGLAEILLARKIKVSGSDIARSAKTEELEKLGATIYEGHQAENIAEDVDLVVYTSAVRGKNNPELAEAEKRGIVAMRRAEFLAEVLKGSKTIAVAGTHGKTTTSSMIAAVLMEAKLDPLVVIGGSVKELNGKNARAGSGKISVVEADEFDRSFLTLKPYIAVMTSLELEHLDIYSDLNDIKQTFLQFANTPSEDGNQGFAIVCIDEPNLREITPRLEKRIVAYGRTSADAKYRASNVEFKAQRTKATIWRGSEVMGELELHVPGEHNLKNALAAIVVGEVLAIPFETTKRALKKFVGAERRFQVRGEAAGVLVIDDYAHHPTEVRAVLETIHKSYPGRRVVACFQPHTFTRTRDFYREFGEVFGSLADQLFLLEIYPAREAPIPGVTSEKILLAAEESGLKSGQLVSTVEELPSLVSAAVKAGDIVLTIGAGTITEAGEPILTQLQQQQDLLAKAVA